MSTVPPPPDPVPPTTEPETEAVAPEADMAGLGGTAPAEGAPHQLVVPRTRTSSAWTGIGIGLFVLFLVIIFIGQNTANTHLSFLWLHAFVPVGLAVLLAFVLGGTVVLLLGVARVAQLRLLARRHRRNPSA